MIGHVGYFGSGKTMALTAFLLKKMKASSRNIIVSNYWVKGGHLYLSNFKEFLCFLEWLYEAKVQKMHQLRGKNIFIAIDEASVWFDSRNFKFFPKNLIAFIRQLRKLSVEIHFTAQSPGSMDKNFRRLTEYWVFHKRPLYWFDKGVSIKNEKGEEIDYIKIPRWFNQFGTSEKWELPEDCTTPDPMNGAVYVGFAGFYRMSKKIHDCYDSTEIVLLEEGGVKRATAREAADRFLSAFLPRKT